MARDRFRRAPRGYPGYAPLPVEMFLARCEDALRSGGMLDPITPEEIASVRFPLVKGGYLRTAVNRELVMLSERIGAVGRGGASSRLSLVSGLGAGHERWRWAARESGELVSEAVAAAGRPFAVVPRWRSGYGRDAVDVVVAGVVEALESWPSCSLRSSDLLVLRLPQSRGGYDEEAVDGFLDRSGAVLDMALR